KHDYPCIYRKAIHLDQQLIESLLTLIVHGADMNTPLPPNGVQLINENYARGFVLGLLEKITHARRADTNEHFNEIAATQRIERNMRLACDCLGEQRLARARGPNQQHTLRNVGSDRFITLRMFQKINHLLKLVLGFFAPGYVAESHARFFFCNQSSLAFAKTQ